MINHNIISLEDLDLIFADYAQEVLGLSQNKVLISYQENGQISSKINEDVVYIHAFIDQNDVSNYKERIREYDSSKDSILNMQHSMRVIGVDFVFYGPNSLVLSTILNDSFFLESGKEFLYKNNLSLIPSGIQNGIELHEKVNERWWKRSDLKMKFYNSIRTYEELQTIEEVNIEYIIADGEEIISNGGN